jgi:hypothetical protein
MPTHRPRRRPDEPLRADGARPQPAAPAGRLFADPDPETFFAEIGEQIAAEVTTCATRSSARPGTGRDPGGLPAPQLPGVGDGRGADPGGPPPVPPADPGRRRTRTGATIRTWTAATGRWPRSTRRSTPRCSERPPAGPTRAVSTVGSRTTSHLRVSPAKLRANLDALAVLNTVPRRRRPVGRPPASRRSWPAGPGGVPSRRSSTTTDDRFGRTSRAASPAAAARTAGRRRVARRSTPTTRRLGRQAMWHAAEALGVDGDVRVLEPGCGSGNFIGLAPTSA